MLNVFIAVFQKYASLFVMLLSFYCHCFGWLPFGVFLQVFYWIFFRKFVTRMLGGWKISMTFLLTFQHRKKSSYC